MLALCIILPMISLLQETPLSIKDSKHARNILAYSRTDLPLAGYSEGKVMHGFAFPMQYKSYVCAQDDR